MKFSIHRDEIHEALQKVASVIPQRSTITMTQNILLTAEGKQLELMTTDLEITMISNVQAEIEEEGAIAVPGRLIHEIIRELPNISLTFESDQNNRMELRSEFGQYKIGGDNPAEFPEKPGSGDFDEIVLPNDVLKRMINKTIFACSTDELRPALTGVFFELTENQMQAIATDGHRLGMLKYTDEALPKKELSAIISTRALNFVLRSIEGEGMTAMMVGDQHALFHMNNTQLYARLIDEAYIDYSRVIPSQTNFDMVIDTQNFLQSVRRVSLFANPISAQIILKIYKNLIQIHAEDVDYGGEANEEIPCEFNGDDFVIGFNSRYLQDMLRHVDSSQMVVQMVRPDYAVLARPLESAEQEEQLLLLMPIRLDEEE